MASENQHAVETSDTQSLEIILPSTGQPAATSWEARPTFLSVEILNSSNAPVSPTNVIPLSTVLSISSVENHILLPSLSNSLDILGLDFAHKVSESLKVSIGSYCSLNTPSLTKSLSPSQLSQVESGELCVICLEKMEDQDEDVYTITECKHRYHEKCIRQWKIEKTICPLCRGPLPNDLGTTKEETEPFNQAFLVRVLRCLPSENERVVTGS